MTQNFRFGEQREPQRIGGGRSHGSGSGSRRSRAVHGTAPALRHHGAVLGESHRKRMRTANAAPRRVAVSALGAEEDPLGSTSRFAQHGRTRHARQTRDHDTVSTQRDARSWDAVLAHLHIGSFLHQAPRVDARPVSWEAKFGGCGSFGRPRPCSYVFCSRRNLRHGDSENLPARRS